MTQMTDDDMTVIIEGKRIRLHSGKIEERDGYQK